MHTALCNYKGTSINFMPTASNHPSISFSVLLCGVFMLQPSQDDCHNMSQHSCLDPC